MTMNLTPTRARTGTQGSCQLEYSGTLQQLRVERADPGAPHFTQSLEPRSVKAMGQHPFEHEGAVVAGEPGPDWIEDTEGYERAYRALHPSVSALVGRLLEGEPGSQWVDGVVSDTFLAMGLKWSEYGQRSAGHLRNTVHRIAVNKVKDLFKSGRLRYDHDHAVEPTEADDEHEYSPGVAAETDTEEEALDLLLGVADPDAAYEDCVQALASEVARYGRESYQQILVWRFVEAHSLEVIAQRLGLGPGTVRNYSAEAVRMASAILALQALASSDAEDTVRVSLWEGLSLDGVARAIADEDGADVDLLLERFVDGRHSWEIASKRGEDVSEVCKRLKTSLLVAWRAIEDHAAAVPEVQR